MQRLRLFILFSLLSILPLALWGNCTLDNTTTPNGDLSLMTSLVGQQFIACETGFVTEIQIRTDGIGNIDLYIADGDGSAITYGSPRQTITPTAAGLITLTLNQPYPVNQGDLYAFAIGGVSQITFDNVPFGNIRDNTVPDGQFSFTISNTNVFAEEIANDLLFKIEFQAPTQSVTTAIPTFSQWSLLLFGLLVLNLSLTFVLKLEKSILE